MEDDLGVRAVRVGEVDVAVADEGQEPGFERRRRTLCRSSTRAIGETEECGKDRDRDPGRTAGR